MTNRDVDLNREPLWSIPPQLRNGAHQGLDRSDYRSFQLSGLYCAMNGFFLTLFGFYAYSLADTRHAIVLFTLAVFTAAGYAAIALGHWYWMARHFTTGVMLVLCLYLFYSGGLQNTGPLYYFVFPTVALFLHGRLRGFIWVIVLLVMTLVIQQGLFDFDVNRYSNAFVTRTIAICLLITVLSCIPEYFRARAERDLLLSHADLEAMTYGDLKTGLANRSLLEKLVQLEYNRNLRYDSACSLLFIEPDAVTSSVGTFAPAVDNARLLTVFADVLRTNLRIQDIAGRWENNCFLLLLPETPQEGAKVMAERLLQKVREQATAFGKQPVRLTASIGIAAFDKRSLPEVLIRAANNLMTAQRNGGNCLSI